MKPKAKQRKAKKRARSTLHTITLNLNREHLGYIREIAEYGCVSVDVVCAVMMATGIFQAKRYRVPVNEEMIVLRAKLDRCRVVMEANDPGNAREIFGAPVAASAAEGAAPVT